MCSLSLVLTLHFLVVGQCVRDVGAYRLADVDTMRTPATRLAPGLERFTVEPPPEGCKEDSGFFWSNPVCCCGIRDGIAYQETCECKRSRVACANTPKAERLRDSFRDVRYSGGTRNKPPPGMDLWWDPFNGGFNVYAMADDSFCRAAPVDTTRFPAVSFKRAHECVCSSTVPEQKAELSCHTDCHYTHCQEGANAELLDWQPFNQELVGSLATCCEAGVYSQMYGCEAPVTPMTEGTAQHIVEDSLRLLDIASVGRNSYASFIVPDPHHIIDLNQVVSAFEKVKEKNPTTSRSGSQFFFTWDYAYILKSIHAPEYEALYKLSIGSYAALSGSQSAPLSRYLEQIGKSPRCAEFEIHAQFETASHPDPLANMQGRWSMFEMPLLQNGNSIGYVHGMFFAYYCAAHKEWRVALKTMLHRPDLLTRCTSFFDLGYMTDDPKHARTRSFMHALQHAIGAPEDLEARSAWPPLGLADEDTAEFTATCTVRMEPKSLINTFVMGFGYDNRHWLVLRNEITALRQELDRAGFYGFHKDFDVFDVKPSPIHSDERALLFGTHFAKGGIGSWTNYDNVRANLHRDVLFMDNALSLPLVDYSLLFTVFYIDSSDLVLSKVSLPMCTEGPLSGFKTVDGRPAYGDARGSILICVSIIDLLMEFTFSKMPENSLPFQKLWGKWTNYGEKMDTMWACLGNPNGDGCSSYTALHPKYDGLDLELETAALEDVSHHFEVLDSGVTPAGVDGEQRKCCCSAEARTCQIVSLNAPRVWSWGYRDSNGCGAILGSGWHSFTRDAKRCIVPVEAARELEGTVTPEADMRADWMKK